MTTPLDRRPLPMIAAIPLGMALNFGPTLVAIHWQWPLYLDVLGTIVVTLGCGWPAGAAAGVLTMLLGGFINPHMPWFCLTQVAVALVTASAARHGGFRTFPRVVVTGLVMAIVAALVSAPFIPLAFGYTLAPGETNQHAYFNALHATLYSSFLGRAAWIEPVDKILQCILASCLVKKNLNRT